MSKKPRRNRPMPTAVPTTFPTRTVAPPPRTGTSRRTSPEDFAEEYAYVWQDMRRVLTLAVIMFIFLIILNVVIQ